MSFASNDILDGKDLDFLREVLEDVCRERAIDAGSDDEKAIADQLINWFLFGIRDRDELKSMLDPLNQPASAPAAE